MLLLTLNNHSFIHSMFSSAATEHCSSFIVNICLSYGSRRYVCIAERNLTSGDGVDDEDDDDEDDGDLLGCAVYSQ